VIEIDVDNVKLEISEMKTTWKWSIPVGSGGNLAINSKKKLNHVDWWIDSKLK
jgi:hypothetical protein